MSTLRFQLDPDRLTLDDYISLEAVTEGSKLDGRELRHLLARFVIDAEGKPVGVEEGERMVGQVSLKVLQDAIASFTEAIKQARDAALPPKSETGD